MKIIQLVCDTAWSDVFRGASMLARSLGSDSVFLSLPTGFLASLIAPARVARLLRDHSEAVILHAHSPEAISAAVRAVSVSGHNGARIVAHLHVTPPRFTLADRKYLDACDAIVTDSQDYADNLVNSGYDPGERLNVIAPGVSIPSSVAPLPCLGSSGNPVTFIHHGQLARENGTRDIVDAFIAIAPSTNARILIAGEGEGRNVMPLIRRCRSEHLEDRVLWTGPVEEIATVIDKSDIGIYGTQYRAHLPLGAIECMAYGRPVITSYSDPVNLADIMLTLATDPGRLTDMSMTVRKEAETRFNLKESASRFKSLYSSIL